jgi:hypothetical protein
MDKGLQIVEKHSCVEKEVVAQQRRDGFQSVRRKNGFTFKEASGKIERYQSQVSASIRDERSK